ncbi:MAG: DNA primase [Erysipelotrichaceae bacterium]|nr:DNA primase [Erysipelotrichaceae bacterium]
MMRLSQEKINEIRQSVDIVDVIGEYLPLEKSGRNYKTICPFHDDKHPSLSISQDKQIYKCFVCGAGGNVYGFLMKYLNISFMEAVKMIADRANIDLSEYDIEVVKPQSNQKFQSLYDMHKEATRLYSYYLHTKLGLEAKTYLIKRHFNDDIIKEFQIGYAPMESILYQSFSKLGFSNIDMVKSGLVLENDYYSDRFNDRIMFPLFDVNGSVIGFSGRIYKPTQTSAKYVNSPESDIFIKGDILYHYHRCREAVKQAGFVYLLEGFMDVIAMYKAGIENTMALMGTALTSGHIRMLRRLTHNIYLCLDGDKAGLAAMSKASQLLLDAGFNVSIIVLPDNHDPDEIYELQGESGLKAILQKTYKPIEFMMDYEYVDTNNYDDRKQYMEKMCEHISKLNDDVDKDYYSRMLSQKSGFSFEIIQQKVSGIAQPQVAYVEKKKTIKYEDKYQKAEHDLLFYMMNSREVALKYEAKAGFMYDDDYRVIASYILDYYRHHSHLEVADLINRIHDEKIISKIIDISQSHLPLNYQSEAIDDYITTIGENAKKLKKKQLLEQFNYILDPYQKAQILNEILKLDEETKKE